MDTKYTDEDLLMALPDFARGAKLDSQLEAMLKKKLESDDSFQSEYQDILKTFNFLSKAKFSEPPDHYFSNLSVRINEKIDSTAKESWWEKLGLFWKIIIPVLPVLIALMIFLLNRDDSRDKLLTLDTTSKTEIPNQTANIPPDNPVDSGINEPDSDSDIAVSEALSNQTGSTSFKLSDSYFFESTDNDDDPNNGLQNNVLADNIEDNGNESIDETDVLLGTDEVEESALDEFFELSPEDQSEILEILKNS